jgi:hypothetical protein
LARGRGGRRAVVFGIGIGGAARGRLIVVGIGTPATRRRPLGRGVAAVRVIIAELTRWSGNIIVGIGGSAPRRGAGRWIVVGVIVSGMGLKRRRDRLGRGRSIPIRVRTAIH